MFREGLKQARLREAAKRGRYVTPKEIAEQVGVSDQTIRDYENGRSEPDLRMIEKLRVIYGAPAEWPPFGSLAPQEIAKPETPADPRAGLKQITRAGAENRRGRA